MSYTYHDTPLLSSRQPLNLDEAKMAIDYSNSSNTSSHNQLPLFGAQQISPADSATNSPHNASPTSLRSQSQLQYHVAGQVRQLRPMKSPLYVPAALRPTERPSRNAPETPPKSVHGSFESLENQGRAVDTRQGPTDLVVNHEWAADDNLGEVTGEPTREHWKADQQSSQCDSPTCRTNFNLFRRRHHCRHCGHVFCSLHTSCSIPLNQDARFHPDGIPSRACDTCHRHYQKWDTARSLKRQNSANSADDDDGGGDGTSHDPDGIQVGSSRGKGGLISPTSAPGQTVGSVPKEYSWSTF